MLADRAERQCFQGVPIKKDQPVDTVLRVTDFSGVLYFFYEKNFQDRKKFPYFVFPRF
jgi:hypothetical protein